MSGTLVEAFGKRPLVAQKSMQDRRSNDELEELLDQLAKLLDRTKILYEQYFMGIQKLPPQQLHRDIERRIRELARERISNTGLRYKLTNLKQKFGSYNSYWRRIMRQIERGTYVRDVARVGRKAAKRGEDIAPEVLQAMPKRMRERILRDRELARAKADRDAKRTGAVAATAAMPAPKGRKPGNVHKIDADADDLDLDALFNSITSEGPGTLGALDDAPAAPAKTSAPAPAKPVARPAPPPRRPAPRPVPRAKSAPVPRARTAPPPVPGGRPAPPPGMSAAQGKQLYDQYVKAKKLVGERTDNLTYNKLMRSLNKQAPGIMTKHKAKGVEFGVVIKNEKVVLKAKPKK